MRLYCAIDLHSNNHVLTIIDDADRRVYERRLPNDLAITKAALEPYRAELEAVAVESTFNWYWLVDGLMEAGYEVRLVNTSAVCQYEGLKHTDDEHDAFWLAHLMRLGILPTGYIYPKSERGLRDLARQRMCLVQHRSSLITSVQNQVWRSTAVRLKADTIKGLGKQRWPQPADPDLALSVKAGRAAINTLSVQIERLEKLLLKRLRLSPQFRLLKTVSGIGSILGHDQRSGGGRHWPLRRRRRVCFLLSMCRQLAAQQREEKGRSESQVWQSLSGLGIRRGGVLRDSQPTSC